MGLGPGEQGEPLLGDDGIRWQVPAHLVPEAPVWVREDPLAGGLHPAHLQLLLELLAPAHPAQVHQQEAGVHPLVVAGIVVVWTV